MAKWADKLISEVKYDDDHSRIIECKVHEDKTDKVGPSFKEARETVAKNLESMTYYTIFKKAGSEEWSKGDNVIRFSIDNEVFIRTDGNKVKSDNLGNLPEY